MASILVPIDFSDASLNAAAYAVRCFGAHGNSFTLLHSYYDPGVADPLIMNITPELDLVARDEMNGFEKRFKERIADPDIDLHSFVLLGSIHGNIADLHEEHAYDVVVMGTHTEGDYGPFFGADVASVIKHVHIPVLSVPAAAAFNGIDHVLLANDGKPVEPAAFTLFMDLVRKHGAEVVVVHVDDPHNTSVAARPDPVYHTMLGDLPHTFINKESAEAAVAIEDVAVTGHMDMVAVLHRHMGTLEGLFHRSMAKQLALHAHIPLLVLQQ